jgi:murein hydrolase activator
VRDLALIERELDEADPGARRRQARAGGSWWSRGRALMSIVTISTATGMAGAQLPPAGVAPAPSAPVASSSGADLDRLLARLDGEEKALTAEIEAIGPKIEVTRRRMLARGRTYYRYVRAGLLPVGGGFDALVDHAARVERTRQALERDLALESQLLQQSTTLGERLTRVRAERAPLELHREAMARARSALLEADERRAAFTRAFESSSRPPEYMAIYGADSGPTDVDPRAGFRALKGRMPFPIAGRAEVRQVFRPGAGGPGLELAAAAGSAVRTVAAGRVVFADRYDDYGLTVILDHGDHYYSVYGNLGSTDARVSENVPSGARLGTVGSEGGREPMVYFELRKGAETVDPAPWFGLQ